MKEKQQHSINRSGAESTISLQFCGISRIPLSRNDNHRPRPLVLGIAETLTPLHSESPKAREKAKERAKMSKLGLLRAVITSNLAVRTAVAHNRGLPMLLGEPARRFSTEAENPPQNSKPSDQLQDASPIEPFLQTPTTGIIN